MPNTTIGLASGDIFSFYEENIAGLADEHMSSNINIDDVIDLINDPVVAPRFRIFVLFPDETINYEIPIDDILTGGSYSENYQNGQRRSLSFTLDNDDGRYTPNINQLWAGTRLSLEMGLERANGSTVWFKKGIYVISSLNPTTSPGNNTVAVQASDKFSLFEDKTGTIDTTIEIPVGSHILNVIQDTLLTSMDNGYPFDSRKIIYNRAFKDKTTQITITKSSGESYGSILLELAQQLSAEIFYNAEGNLTLVPINESTLDLDKPLIYHFDAQRGDLDNLSYNFNMNEIVNRVVVLGSSNNGGVYRAVAENNDARSPLCIQRIGRRTGSIINDGNITAQYLAEERAQYELRNILILKTSTSLNVPFNPLVTVNNLVSVSEDFFSLSNEKFLVQSVSCSLDYTATTSISVTNLNNLPFLVGSSLR